MWSITASHRPPSPLSLWEAVSPAVTDCHSHGNSFTNIHHSFHTATMAGSHAGKYLWTLSAHTNMPPYSKPLLGQHRILKGFTPEKKSSQWHFLTMLFMHLITWCEHLFMCCCQCCSQDHLNLDKYIDTETRPRLKVTFSVERVKTHALGIYSLKNYILDLQLCITDSGSSLCPIFRSLTQVRERYDM